MVFKQIKEKLYTEEFTHAPVHPKERKHWLHVSVVWMGFTMATSLAVLGGIVQQGVGIRNGLIAIFIGNLLLFIYANFLGYISYKTGLNFPLVAKRAFGSQGFIFASFILALLVLGWFAVQADLAGVLLQKTVLSAFPRWAVLTETTFCG